MSSGCNPRYLFLFACACDAVGARAGGQGPHHAGAAGANRLGCDAVAPRRYFRAQHEAFKVRLPSGDDFAWFARSPVRGHTGADRACRDCGPVGNFEDPARRTARRLSPLASEKNVHSSRPAFALR